MQDHSGVSSLSVSLCLWGCVCVGVGRWWWDKRIFSSRTTALLKRQLHQLQSNQCPNLWSLTAKSSMACTCIMKGKFWFPYFLWNQFRQHTCVLKELFFLEWTCIWCGCICVIENNSNFKIVFPTTIALYRWLVQPLSEHLRRMYVFIYLGMGDLIMFSDRQHW